MSGRFAWYRWLFGTKTKDQIFVILKKYFGDIEVLRNTHKLLLLVRDNAGESKLQELNELFESKGIQNDFSTPYEQWQNGLAKSSINSFMKFARSTMVESGLGGQFWFSAAMAAKDVRIVTYKERMRMTPWEMMHGS